MTFPGPFFLLTQGVSPGDTLPATKHQIHAFVCVFIFPSPFIKMKDLTW